MLEQTHFPLIETLTEQRAFYAVTKDGPTLQPAFERWFWLEIPLADSDAAAICCMGH